jgi:hypothetical protein
MTDSAASVHRDPRALTAAQTESYDRLGYLSPLVAMPPSEAQAPRRKLEADEASQGGRLRGPLRTKPHLVFTWAAELVRHAAILDAVEDLLGPDLLVWSRRFFIKDGHDSSYVSWYQDSTYWR